MCFNRCSILIILVLIWLLSEDDDCDCDHDCDRGCDRDRDRGCDRGCDRDRRDDGCGCGAAVRAEERFGNRQNGCGC